MIDTLSVKSNFITNELAEELEKFMLRKQAIYNDKILYSFDIIPFKGSYSNKINIQVSREMWVYNEFTKIAEKKSCKPYIKIEGSIHKFFLGHNCFGGSDNVYQLFYRMLKTIEKDLDLKNRLPLWHTWIVVRIDYAKIYKVGSQKNVLSYFYSLKNVTYPRAKKIFYQAGESVQRGGRYTAIKIYNKYLEFKEHDYKIWKKNNIVETNKILDYTKDVIRIEIEVKSNKFKYDYKKDITIQELRISYLDRIYKEEVRRLLNEGEEMKKLKNNYSVRMYLQNVCTDSEFKVLYSFYNDLVLNGKDIVRATTSKSTFYRNLKKLDNYGINYINHDIVSCDIFKFNPIIMKDEKEDLIAI